MLFEDDSLSNAKIDGLTYTVPRQPRLRKRQPRLLVVITESCTSCAGSPLCAEECPVDCIHLMSDDDVPVRVYIDNQSCIGCMKCLSFTLRPKHVVKGDVEANAEALNRIDSFEKNGPCPWDAIEVLPFDSGAERSKLFYSQPRDGERAEPSVPATVKPSLRSQLTVKSTPSRTSPL